MTVQNARNIHKLLTAHLETAGPIIKAYESDEEKNDVLRRIITLFLSLNCEPADAQVHALASALAVDKEYLESIMYEMLAEAQQQNGEVLADSEEILEDKYDPDITPADEVALNDGAPSNNDDTGYQEETTDDGVDDLDSGAGIGIDTSDVLTDDGVPNLEI